MEPARTFQIETDFSFLKKGIFSEQEETTLRSNLHVEKLEILTLYHKYLLNLRSLIPKPTPLHSILFLHGHGGSPSWRSWLKLALIFFDLGYNCFLIDMPGFGNSLVDGEEGASFKSWQEDGPEFYKAMLEKIGVKKVFTIARCGGAALTIRTICKYPELFEASHVFHNNMISSVPEVFEANLKRFGMKLFVTWNEDPDHLKLSVGYKWYNNRRKEKKEYLHFIDISDEDYYTHYFKNPGFKKGKRRLEQFQIMDPSRRYIDFVVYFVTNNKFKEF